MELVSSRRERRRGRKGKRRRRPSPELHWGKNFSRGHIPRVETHGSGESLLGRSVQLPGRSGKDLVRFAVTIAGAVALNFLVLYSLSWFDLRDAFASLPSLVVIFFILVPVGLALVLGYHFLRGRKRPAEEVPVFLVGFALLVVGIVAYEVLWFLIELFRQRGGS